VSTTARARVVAGLRLLRCVGRGGEGEVWEARDDAGRARALKLIRPECLAEPEDVEARGRWLLRIDHPALVRVYRGGRLLGGPLAGWGYVEMDYVDGPSLASAGRDDGALERLLPLAEALDLLHTGAWSDGVPLVHRDVKPANIVAAASGLVLVDPSTLRGVDATHLTRIGTPVFCAPEVVTGRIGPAADVYSFAATAVALLTGARGDALVRLLDEPQRCDVPDGVRLALSSRPGDRPVSCRSLLEPGSALGWQVVDPDVSWGPDPRTAGSATTAVARPAHRGEGLQWPDSGPEAAAGPRWDDRPPEVELAAAATGGSHAFGGGPQRHPSERPRPPRWGRWFLVLAVLVAAPAVGWVGGAIPRERLLVAAAAVAVVHFSAQLLAGGPLGLAVLAPPVAWAFLIADRTAGSLLRRSWTRAVVTGALAVVTVALTAPLQGPQPAALVLGGAGVGVALAGVGAAMSGARGGGAALVRLLLLPCWLAGALVIVAGTAACLPFAVVAGRAAAAARLAGRTIGSVVETFRGPRIPA